MASAPASLSGTVNTIDPELYSGAYAVLRLASDHIFARKATEPRVLDAALAFIKRRYPEIWNSSEGVALVAKVREIEGSETLYGDTAGMRAALAAAAVEIGMTDMTFDHKAFKS